ncbi:hypothetical protein [Spirobacillus cienkowskii]|jgi:hypothetical protein|uniref:hypothetical protein n=1 Tax=Spirobacillus cienkowskii TaxID=495820 RepID=UPI0030D4717E
MDEYKAEAAGVTHSIVKGLGKRETAPFVLMGLCVFLLIALASLNIFFIFKYNNNDNDKNYLEKMTLRWEGMVKQMGEFTKELAISNGSIIRLREQSSELKETILEVKTEVKDHEKRLNKIESKIR